MEHIRKRALDAKSNALPVIVSILCFAYFATFLIRYGEMLPTGSDEVANTAYAITAFGDVHRAGWSVPKPFHMLLLGVTYAITGNLWFVNAIFLIAAALLVYYASQLMSGVRQRLIPPLVFAALLMTMPFSFGTTLRGGSGLLSTLSIFVALSYLQKPDCSKNRVMAIVFLSIANLTRPENWVNTFLIVSFMFAWRYLPKRRLPFRKNDLLFLIPFGMPFLWHLVDYAVFGDFFYSTHIAQRFVLEYVNRNYTFDWHKYPDLLKSSFFGTFYLHSWLSPRTLVILAFTVTGIVVLFQRQRRMLFFMILGFLGTIAFYFATYVKGMLFLRRFLFYDYICIFLFLSVGVARFARLALYLPVRYLRNLVQVAAAALVVLYFVYTPFHAAIGSQISQLKHRSVAVRRENKAIDALKEDMLARDSVPIVITTLLVSPARVSLKLHTGKDIYLFEKLVGLKRLGVKHFLPKLEGRTVYAGYHKSVGGDMKKMIQGIEGGAGNTQTVYDDGVLRISRNSY